MRSLNSVPGRTRVAHPESTDEPESPHFQGSVEKLLPSPKSGKMLRDLLQVVMTGSLLTCAVTAFAGPRLFHLLSGMIFLLTAAGHTCVNHRRLFYEVRRRFS
jgi:hypothetical protein